jgi:hypothetical protein
MSDVGDSASTSTDFDAGGESTDAVEINSEGFETAETELYTSEAEQELYDPGYDPSEYEQELTDFSYEAKNPDSYTKETDTPKYNDKGEPVEDVPLYRDGDYLNYDDPDYIETGRHHANWPEGDGFEGETTETVLSENTIIARYGSESGRYATDVGTNPTDLSLPYDTDTQEYHEYRVCRDVTCVSGKIGAAFDVDGGGTQYQFSKSFSEMVSDGTLEKIK